MRKKTCPLPPRKRTCAVQLAMSATGQKRTCLKLIVQTERPPRGGLSEISSHLRSRLLSFSCATVQPKHSSDYCDGVSIFVCLPD
jgi:hypothetical protein